MHHSPNPLPPQQYVKAYRDERDVLRLPMTPDGTTPVFRLALKHLFQVTSGDDERLVTRELGTYSVSTPHGVEKLTINYKGLQLGQGDLDVLIALQRLAAPVGLGQDAEVSGRRVLEAAGLSDCKDNYVSLKASLNRLWLARFTVASASISSGLPWQLLRSYTHRVVSRNGAGAVENANYITYALGEEWGELFHKHTWVKLDTEMRRSLRGQGERLARWLHALLTSCGPQYTTDLAELYELSGAECQPEAFAKQFDMAAALLLKHGAIARVDDVRVSRLHIKDKTLQRLRRRRVKFIVVNAPGATAACRGGGILPRGAAMLPPAFSMPNDVEAYVF